jgi:hypothetical protein
MTLAARQIQWIQNQIIRSTLGYEELQWNYEDKEIGALV